MGITRPPSWRTVAAAVAAVGMLWLATAGAAPTTCRDAMVRSGGTGTWTFYDAPIFPQGDSIVTAHAIDPQSPNRWYITNGQAIMASQDGGCSWSASYTLPATPTADQPVATGTGRVHALSAGGGRVLASLTGATTVEAPAETPPTGVRPEAGSGVTVVLTSADGGASWQNSAAPLSNDGGAPGPLVQSRSNPDTVFVGTGTKIRRSTDGGATFTSAFPLVGAKVPTEGAPADPAPEVANVAGGINEIAPDPVDGQVVLARGDHFVWRSTDGGQIFDVVLSTATLPDVPEGATLFGPAFSRQGAQPGRVTFTLGGPTQPGVMSYLVSEDGGETYDSRGIEQMGRISGAPLSLVAGNTMREDVILTTQTFTGRGIASVYRWHPAVKRLVDVDDFGLGELRGTQVDASGQPLAHFFNGRKLITWELPPGGMAAVKVPGEPDFLGKRPNFKLGPDGEPERPPDTPKGPQGTLSPPGGDVKVPPGGSTEVAYDLKLPARPSRLDTFFLLDTSGSTDPYIIALSRGLTRLAQSLADDRIDAWFGLGEYQDRLGIRYRRRSDLRPPDDQFLRYQLDSIRTTGGQEPGYTAVHQAVSGTGVANPQNGDPVPAGRNAHWRRGTARLLLQVADEPFSDDPDGADREAAVEALKGNRVAYVGAVVTKRPLPQESARVCGTIDTTPAAPPTTGTPVKLEQDADSYRLLCQMVDLARAAGTLAPAGGVDCDGDEQVDIPQGEPLVCVIPNARVDGLPDAVRRLAGAVRLEQPVRLQAGEGTPIKTEIAPAADYNAVNVRQDNALAFTAKFSCEPEQEGKEFDVAVQAVVDDLPVAQAAPKVVCGEKPAVAPVIPPRLKKAKPAQPALEKAIAAAVPPVPVAAPLVVPQPPPPVAQVPSQAPAQGNAPVSQPATGQVASTQVSQVQASAAQQEKQVQVAVEKVRIDDDPSVSELNFAREPQEAPGHWPWLVRTLGMAGVLGAAGAAMSRRRTNSNTRKVHIR
jgi:hypothetical protein